MKISEATLNSYLQTVIGAPTDVTRIQDRQARYIDNAYDRYLLQLGGQTFLAIVVKDTREFTPTAFLKHLKVIRQSYPMDWVLVFEDLPAYVAHRLRAHNIPFMVPFRQLYWPFIGQIVSSGGQPTATARLVDKLTPASQGAVIAALTGKLPSMVSVSDLAAALQLSKMSASRIANELVAAGIAEDSRMGRERMLILPDETIAIWETALPYLTSPVRQSFYVFLDDMPVERRLKAGETGLAAKTMLAPPRVPTFAVGRDFANDLQSRALNALDNADDGEAVCLVEKWKYDPRTTADGNVVDRFSLYLSLRDRPDERLQIALEELMEQYFDPRYRPIQSPFRRPF
ncbi:MarR family transcriptional regulator [Mesorhizobium plurifarium]|uniref:MarR family transcriptional regulator n=1 Tax=Sinorhizobium arboris TaxID=76745 RepID=UPI00048635DD|nr:helix-turn-helix domain-containing protein [Sinorhizobium arboris]PST26390.1 MarR family transcriptional regulator [Mesorhizobium plurifarium]